MQRFFPLRRLPQTSRTPLNHFKPPNRFNSSSSTANATKNAQSKASDALGAAQKGAEKVLAGAKSLGESVGNSVASILGGYKEPVLYNLAVTRELFKQVYIRESLTPPTSLSTYTATYRSLFERLASSGYWRSVLESGEWVKIGVYGLEAYFIFHIGEMIGRRGIFGYKIEGPNAAHH